MKLSGIVSGLDVTLRMKVCITASNENTTEKRKSTKPPTHLDIFTHSALVLLETAHSTQGQQHTEWYITHFKNLLYCRNFLSLPLSHTTRFSLVLNKPRWPVHCASSWEKWKINRKVCQFSSRVSQCAAYHCDVEQSSAGYSVFLVTTLRETAISGT